MESGDPYAFLQHHAGQPRFLYWNNGAGMAGAGIAAELTTHGPERLRAAKAESQRWNDRIVVERGPAVPLDVGPRWIGGFAFAAAPNPPSADFPDLRFFLPRSQLIFHGGHAYETVVGGPPEAATPPHPPTGPRSAARIRAWTGEPEFDAWARAIRGALHAIHEGSLEKVVLARSLTAQPPADLQLAPLLRRLWTTAPASKTFLVEPRPGAAFLGSSPELLVSRDDGLVTTSALAGSRPRGRTEVEDEAQARNLRSSSKEAWEHELVCRYLREALTTRGQPWTTPFERRALKLPNIQHLETRFESPAQPHEHVLDLAQALHPTPAVAGYPQRPALDLINQLEPTPRGWYAGAVGWFDADGRGEMAVSLRTAALADGRLRLHAGCGIVGGSDPAEEWEESRAKFQLLIDAWRAEEAGP